MKFNKTAKNVIIASILFVLIKLIVPPVNGLTDIGINVIGVFIAIVYLWLTEGVGWVSLVAILLFVCTGVMPINAIFANSFGSWVTVFMISTMILNYLLTDLGIVRRLVVWAISRKFLEKKPWLFIICFFSAIYLAGLIIDATAGAAILLPLTIELCEQIGCKKGERLPKVLFLGASVSLGLAYLATPISHALPVVFMGLIGNDFDRKISMLDWCSVGIPTSLILLVLVFLYLFVVLRPDVSLINQYDAEAARQSIKPMGRDERIGCITYFVVIFLWLAPDLLKPVLPAVATWLAGAGVSFPVGLAILFLCVARSSDGKALLDFDAAIKNVSWAAVFLSAVITLLGPALTAENTGISVLISTSLGPLLQDFNSWVILVLIAAIWVVIQTNFMSCLVSGQMVYSAFVPIILALPQLGVNGIAFGIMVGMGCCFAILTPPSTASTALFMSTGWYTPTDGLKYCVPLVFAAILVHAFVAYPLGSILF